MKVLVRPNFDKPGSAYATRRVLLKLSELGMTPMLDRKDTELAAAERECLIGDFDKLLPECDLLLTIGGDGTILHAVQATKGCRKPILGVNAGRIGFMTQLEADELDHLKLLSEGKYTTLYRMMLEVTMIQDGVEETFFALNEAVLSRGDSDRLVEIKVTSGGRPVAVHRADGVIFSTPTGSTAYNLAAGGAIAHPSLEMILMTAVCPHSHFNRSLILSPGESYEAREIPGNNNGGLVVTVDGTRAGVLRIGSHLAVKRSDESIPFVDLGVRDFYSCVDLKLSFRR